MVLYMLNILLALLDTDPYQFESCSDSYFCDVFQLAFASTPLFEPFSIPLLLEKLSSSLPSAKVGASPFQFSFSFYLLEMMILFIWFIHRTICFPAGGVI